MHLCSIYWKFTSQEIFNFIDGGQTTEQQSDAGTNYIDTTSKTDRIETVNTVAKSYLTQMDAHQQHIQQLFNNTGVFCFVSAIFDQLYLLPN